MSNITDKLKQHGAKDRKVRTEPLWTGPGGDGPNGGISFSLLSRWLVCKERFRIYTIEGLIPHPKFEPRMEFGNMWHICEESYSGNISNWQGMLTQYCQQQLIRKYPTQQPQIAHWYEMCKAQFPLYLDYWQRHDRLHRQTKVDPILHEKAFDVPYSLPSGRKVRLRGKWDSIFVYNNHLWVMDNKTKSTIDIQSIVRQLSFDAQTMLYLIALKEFVNCGETKLVLPIAGVRYNVIRRSAHKSAQSMVQKISEDARNGRIGEWFARWDSQVSDKDIQIFKEQCFHPILETLCNWWDWAKEVENPFDSDNKARTVIHHHWQHPYGVYNVLDQGGITDIDHYIQNGSRVGLTEATTLFPELENI